MANFTRVKPAGWGANDSLTSAEMNQLDTDHAKSVNGDDGGTWNGAITWGGQHTFNDAVVCNDTVNIAGTLTMQGKAVRSGNGAGDVYRVGTIGDEDKTIDTSKDLWVITAAPATVDRTITLDSTPAPADGEIIRVAMFKRNATGQMFLFRREDSTQIAETGTTTGTRGAYFEFAYVASQGGWIVTMVGGNAGAIDVAPA